jgi:hypothetical protein
MAHLDVGNMRMPGVKGTAMQAMPFATVDAFGGRTSDTKAPSGQTSVWSLRKFGVNAKGSNHFLNRLLCDLLWTPLPLPCVSVVVQIFWTSVMNWADKDAEFTLYPARDFLRCLVLVLIVFGSSGVMHIFPWSEMHYHFTALPKFYFHIEESDGLKDDDGTAATGNWVSKSVAGFNIFYLVWLLFIWFFDIYRQGNPCGDDHYGHKLWVNIAALVGVVLYVAGEMALVNHELGIESPEEGPSCGKYKDTHTGGVDAHNVTRHDHTRDDKSTHRYAIKYYANTGMCSPRSWRNIATFMVLLIVGGTQLAIFSKLTDYRQDMMFRNTCVREVHNTGLGTNAQHTEGILVRGSFAMGKQYNGYVPCPVFDTCDPAGMIPVPHMTDASRDDPSAFDPEQVRAQDQWDKFYAAMILDPQGSQYSGRTGNTATSMLTGVDGWDQQRPDCGYTYTPPPRTDARRLMEGADLLEMPVHQRPANESHTGFTHTFTGHLYEKLIDYDSLKHCRPGSLVRPDDDRELKVAKAVQPTKIYKGAKLHEQTLIGQKQGVSCPELYSSVRCCSPVYEPEHWTCTWLNFPFAPWLSMAFSPVCNCDRAPFWLWSTPSLQIAGIGDDHIDSDMADMNIKYDGTL